MKLENPFRNLTRPEGFLYAVSVAMVTLSGLFGGSSGLLSTAASLIGVTALIFVARGEVLGQILTVVFSVFYAIVSYSFRYYGEMITYVGMTAPVAAMSVISWLRHPFENSRRVEVARLSGKNIKIMSVLTVAVTVAFYFILRALGNATLTISTLSIATSFLASYLQLFRSPYYAVAYALNDIVLVVLWVIAAIDNLQYLSMVVCFAAFLLNDIYGFYNWKRMQKIQTGN